MNEKRDCSEVYNAVSQARRTSRASRFVALLPTLLRLTGRQAARRPSDMGAREGDTSQQRREWLADWQRTVVVPNVIARSSLDWRSTSDGVSKPLEPTNTPPLAPDSIAKALWIA